MATIDDLYDEEVKQADIDHHTPTAGAMTSHILANLHVNEIKLHQTLWFIKGINSVSIKHFYESLIDETRSNFDELGKLLLDENELPPSTTEEYRNYTMLEEDGRNKYRSQEELIDITVHDYATQNMFIDRAIALSQKEIRPVLAQYLTTLRGNNNHTIQTLQAMLGKSAWDGLIEEDEDD